jgi:SSS family transporter
VLVAYLTSAIVVGLLAARKSGSLESYLLGDRDLPWWAILGSIVATETSAATVLSVPGEGYGPTGMKFLQLALGYVVGRLLIVQLLMPLYFRGKLQTAYEVLRDRFGGVMQPAASLLFLAARNVGDGLRLLLAAIVLEKLLGLPVNWRIAGLDPFMLSALVMGVVSTVYTFVGGMRSVIWNDCIQFGVYVVGGILALAVIASQVSGGLASIFEFATVHNKLQVIALGPSTGDVRPFWVWLIAEPYTLWAGLIGGAILTLGTHGTDHSMVQRYLAARSQRDASRALAASGLVVFVQFAMFLFIGVGLACFFDQHPVAGLKKDEVFAHFIVHEFPRNTGLVGLMLAAILASNLSSSLSASAASVVHDFYLPTRETPPESWQLLWLSRWLTVAFGGLQIAIGIGARSLYERDSTVVATALAVAGFAFGLLLGVFALGVFTRRANQWDAIVGAVTGLIVLLVAQFAVPQLADRGYLPQGMKVGFPWFAVIGSATTFLVGLALSQLHPARGTTT